MRSGLHARVLSYLQTHYTLTLATVGSGKPWATDLFYVNDAFVLYWLSDPRTRHCQNIAREPHVAITIHEEYRDWRTIQGIQMEGTAEQIGPIHSAERQMQLYAVKYSFLSDWRNPPSALATALENARVYRFTPSRVLFIDNTREFGHREEIDPSG